jgi:glucose-1-phosphate adenylyltransferase
VATLRIDDALKKTSVMLLAGGQGERLYPLTRDRAKPAVPFGGIYRIIDFTLSNCMNSGLRRINVLTQYKSFSLQRHLDFGWSLFRPEFGEHINVIPPQQRGGSHWYLGTADAIYQNIYTLERERPDNVLVASGDHIYKMNYRHMLESHCERDADLTIACFATRLDRARGQLGVALTDDDGRLTDFREKAIDPPEMPGRPGYCFCSMGVYLFKTETLVREVVADAKTDSEHDFGKNVILSMIRKDEKVCAYELGSNDAGEEPYWRDIGTLDAYWEANNDLVQVQPAFNLYDRDWAIHTYQPQAPPVKTVFNEPDGRQGKAMNSIVASGSIISGGYVEDSVLSPNVHVHSGADVRQCVLLDDVHIGRGARLRKAIIDKRVRIPQGTVIGYDPKLDKARFTVSENGVVVVPKGTAFADA